MSLRKIVHVDMDCFYAAIEMRDRPDIADKPVVVGGNPDGRGVVATANYQARKFGVRSAMASATAKRLCPDLVFVRPSFSKYKEESKKIREVFREYTDKIEPLSLDEAYLDVTGVERCGGFATRMAKEIRQKIFDRCQLAASAGIAPNKMLAKVASDWNKPNGQLTIRPEDVASFVVKLPVRKINGVGKVTGRRMQLMGINTCGDLQKLSVEELTKSFGKWGGSLFKLCRGEDDRPVQTSWERKSLSTEETYAKDINNEEDLLQRIDELYEEFVRRWQKSQLDWSVLKSIVIKIKYNDFTQLTRESAFEGQPTAKDFYPLLKKAWQAKEDPVRLLGVGAKLRTEKEIKSNSSQLDFFS